MSIFTMQKALNVRPLRNGICLFSDIRAFSSIFIEESLLQKI